MLLVTSHSAGVFIAAVSPMLGHLGRAAADRRTSFHANGDMMGLRSASIPLLSVRLRCGSHPIPCAGMQGRGRRWAGRHCS